MIINLKNQVGMVKQRKLGFSWTTFFFGFFPAIFRGDWKWAIIQFLCASITFGLSSWVFCFVYNKLHINDLLEKGYVPSDNSSRSILISKGIISADSSAAFA
ncbi:hypothetical protein MJA45_04205 [Paenibacillus aurantius]|uniref:HrgC protein n=1 Tax=Paenibacillus aurantius TaxID=2918900 RepID=A0AA96LEI7_9BACL|nr:hypothetical protein [Paenibacillus aurantius]WNQ12261.1 hypothetical protein MJA45_04205 [Paenibacillus aurantius]